METIIYGKKPSGNGFITTLEDHTNHVLHVIRELSIDYQLDKRVSEIGVIFHDLGKIHCEFQSRLLSDNFDYVHNDIFRHEIVSIFFLKYLDKSLWDRVIDMVIGHHKSINEEKGILGYVDKDPNVFNIHSKDFDKWGFLVPIFLKKYGKILEIKDIEYTIDDARECFDYVVEYCEGKPNGISEYRGLLMSADRIGSSLGNQVYHIGLNVVPDLTDCFKGGNEFYPLSKKVSNKDLRHTLVIAPTGAGKTDFLLKRTSKRIFYILPYQASINAMSDRIGKQFHKVEDIRVLHSSSRSLVDSKDYVSLSLQRLPGSSIKILTPFQLFNIIFTTKGYEINYLDLKGVDIIIDEIHVYDGNSRSAIEKLISLLVDMGCNIHIGTATIGDEHKGRLLSILGNDTQVVEFDDEEFKIYDRHIVHKISDFESVNSKILDISVKNNEKIIIVSNTVNGAIEYYNRINELYPNVEKILLHSRFKRKDRKRKEYELINYYNKLVNKPCFLISTQVIEVSLDINFDLMVTECAPFPDLIQRFGRINRVRNEDTLGKYKNVYVIEPPNNAWKCKPYELDELIQTWDILEDSKLLEEKENVSKINKVNFYGGNTNINDYINYDFKTKRYKIKELTHTLTNAMENIIDTESLVCIIESDKEKYKVSNYKGQIEFEIPINYKLGIKYLSSQLKDVGSEPIVLPDDYYNEEIGLILKKK